MRHELPPDDKVIEKFDEGFSAVDLARLWHVEVDRVREVISKYRVLPKKGHAFRKNIKRSVDSDARRKRS